MIKKLLYTFPVIAILFAGCSDNKNLTGKFSNSDNDEKMIYLFESKSLSSPYEPVDSMIIKNGAFAFDRKDVTAPNVAFLAIKMPAQGTPDIIPFINENGDISISIDSLITIKGTKMNVEYQQFIDNMRASDTELSKISSEASTIQDNALLQPYIDKMQEIHKQQADIVYNYVKENIKNNIGEFFLISYASVLDMGQIKELVGLASPELQAELQPLLGNSGLSNGVVGKQYTDVTGNTPDGRKISLSNYIGKNKVVLIDFWASWCGPCIKEMPHVVDVYKKYKSKGFEIVGISLDEDKDAWANTIKKLNMTWPQMSDLKGWQSELSKPYNITGIPFTLLVDQDGRIIAENLRGDDIEKKLKEVLK